MTPTKGVHQPGGLTYEKLKKVVRAWFARRTRRNRRRLRFLRHFFFCVPRQIDIILTSNGPHIPHQCIQYQPQYGLSFEDLKKLGLDPEIARSLGISINTRRHDKCADSINRTAKRPRRRPSVLVLNKQRILRSKAEVMPGLIELSEEDKRLPVFSNLNSDCVNTGKCEESSEHLIKEDDGLGSDKKQK